ncbi:MAG: hypothetical protein ACJASX_004610, partial [Limisphaerales bacterium]
MRFRISYGRLIKLLSSLGLHGYGVRHRSHAGT